VGETQNKHTASVCRHIYNNLKLHEKMAIKSHRQTKLRDQCVLLRFYCENAKKSACHKGEAPGEKWKQCGVTANMTASAKRFIIYLLAEIGTEANRETRVKVGKVTELGATTMRQPCGATGRCLLHWATLL